MTNADKKKAMIIGGLIAVIIIILLLMRRASPIIEAGDGINIPSIPGVDFPITIFDIPGLSLYEGRGSCGCGTHQPKPKNKGVVQAGGSRSLPISTNLPPQRSIFSIGKMGSQMTVGWR